MYIPRNLPLRSPHLSTWLGGSGKRYDFAVVRPDALCLDEPAVFILARHTRKDATALYAGFTGDGQLGPHGTDPAAAEVWRRAAEMGMTHVHLRFEARADAERRAEAADLAAVLTPPLNNGRLVGGDVLERLFSLPSGDDPRRTMRLDPARTVNETDRWLDSADDEEADAALEVAPASSPAPPAAMTEPPTPSVEQPAPPPETVTLMDTVADTVVPAPVDALRVREAEGPTILFAGEVSHAAGADILLDALFTVAADDARLTCVFVGDGPMRGELEARAGQGGIAHRCRFLGHVEGSAFDTALADCDFVVVPARARQDPGITDTAIASNKPVLITHQSEIRSVVHGVNGLVAYDNPGSIVWGIRELLARRATVDAT